ncbi:hypothetical protein COM97_18620 [Bacillus thuringiensis]|uniref:hypothetical protein n=1 Tax=Bacillus thuringiensis TaxID=1428 RepID=UPI000BED2207|nr:hypothetical protein [Bacillus thuringiensis]PEF05050.1 hypothetical protein COM97_18620 [Bacillus thuringiensis]
MEGNSVLKQNKKGTEYLEVNGKISAKRCTICGEMKELICFSNQKQGLGGTVSRCKPCVVEFNKKQGYDAKYYERNKATIRERRRIADKKYYEKHREEILEKSKKQRNIAR